MRKNQRRLAGALAAAVAAAGAGHAVADITIDLSGVEVDGAGPNIILAVGEVGTVLSVDYDFVYSPIPISWSSELVIEVTGPGGSTTGGSGGGFDVEFGGADDSNPIGFVGSSAVLNGSSADGVWSVTLTDTFDDGGLDGVFEDGSFIVIRTDADLATGACCFDDGMCHDDTPEANCDDAGGTWQGADSACGKIDCPVLLESVDVAIRDAATGNRVFVRGFRDGTVEHKFYTVTGGYTPWTEVPDPGNSCVEEPGLLEAVEAIALDPEALIYIRAFDDGRFEQNIYTTGAGWTGWFAVPHPENENGKGGEKQPIPEKEGGDVVESVDVEPFNGLPSARMFVRAWRSGLIEQCIYTPEDGYTPWSEIPPMGDLIDIVEGIGDETVESVQVTAEGGLFDRRIFVIGLTDRKIFQNIYTPGDGYTGWKRVRNQGTVVLGDNPLVSTDVQHVGDGVVIYLRGRENGRVDQNIYTPADGFTGFKRLPAPTSGGGRTLESCCVELIDPGYFGARIYLRAFDNGDVEQAFYTPEGGQTMWQEIPGGHN